MSLQDIQEFAINFLLDCRAVLFKNGTGAQMHRLRGGYYIKEKPNFIKPEPGKKRMLTLALQGVS